MQDIALLHIVHYTYLISNDRLGNERAYAHYTYKYCI